MNQDRLQALTLWARRCEQDPQLQLQLISGDASFRRYYRAHGKIWVDAPPQTEKNSEFIRNAQALQRANIAAPVVMDVDLQQGFLCVSDLGDVSLLSRLDSDSVRDWYAKAIGLLPAVAGVDLLLEPFDADFMARENSIFPEWLLGQHLGLTLDAGEQALLADTFSLLTDNNLSQPQVVMHRDFHSRNLMVLADDSLAVIDFQDMVLGPLTYDLVSLIKDCYVRWPLSLVNDWVSMGYQVYRDADLLAGMDESQFRRALALTGMQRHLKAAGIFCRLHHRDGKSGYLKDIPRTLFYVYEVAAAEPVLQPFADWLLRRVLPHFPYQPASEVTSCEP
jgi:N-acetylmuramate 1-kinase